MKPIIYIIAGHSKSTPGATAYTGISEHTYTVELQSLVAKQIKDCETLQGTSMDVITEDQIFSNYQVRQMINTYATAGSRGIDIHFNNNNPSATGTEVVVSRNTSNENKLRAENIARRISVLLNIPHRKRVQSRGYMYPDETFVGALAILDETKIPMILVEVCFLNENDLKKYEANKKEVAKIIVEEMLK